MPVTFSLFPSKGVFFTLHQVLVAATSIGLLLHLQDIARWSGVALLALLSFNHFMDVCPRKENDVTPGKE